MRSARIEMAIEDGLFSLPESGWIAVYRPVAGDDLSALPKGRVVVLTGFRPDYEHFAAQGYRVEPTESYAAALVCLPRARDLARALLAEAARDVALGGPIAVDGQKTDGVDSMLKDLRGRLALSDSLSKAHGKIAVFAAEGQLQEWTAQKSAIDGGFITQPGVFSADAPDRGSLMLAQALPAKLGPKVVDLGAGWGYLSRHILEKEGVKRLDLVEAEALSLDCARENVKDERASFHWADALAFKPAALAETVVMNPPFHTGRSAEPALGAAFIAAARRMLAPDGVLWMVANRHLPYDPVLEEHFLEVENVAGDNAFRVIRAAKPRRKNR